MAASGAPDTTITTPDEGLVRAIGLGSAVLFVLGSVIGSGIFLTTGEMAAALPSATPGSREASWR
jgi:amino acid transporter